MLIKIKRTLLIEAIDNVSKAIKVDAPVPSLTGLVIEVKPDYLNVIGSNGQFTIKQTIKKEVNVLSINKIGTILFKKRYIYDLIKKLNDDIIQIEAHDETMVKIYADNSEYELRPLKYSSYPNINFDIPEGLIEMSTNDLLEMLNFVKNAAGDKLKRIVLTGIHMVLNNNTLSSSATNSFRLAKYVSDTKTDGSFDIVVPAGVAKDVASLLTEDNKVKLAVANNRLVLLFDNIHLQANLIDGEFPDVNKLIPSEFDIEFKINRQKLINAIDRACVVSGSENKIVHIEITEKKLFIKNRTQDIGAANEDVEINPIKEGSLKIGFNSAYVIDSLKCFNDEEVIVRINDAHKPVIFNTESNTNNVQLVLPYRT